MSTANLAAKLANIRMSSVNSILLRHSQYPLHFERRVRNLNRWMLQDFITASETGREVDFESAANYEVLSIQILIFNTSKLWSLSQDIILGWYRDIRSTKYKKILATCWEGTRENKTESRAKLEKLEKYLQVVVTYGVFENPLRWRAPRILGFEQRVLQCDHEKCIKHSSIYKIVIIESNDIICLANYHHF